MLSRTSARILTSPAKVAASRLLSTQPVFMWGTDTDGSLWKPKDPSETAKKRDVPVEIDVASVLETSAVKKVVCGATDSAILLEDGRCFVMGQNKNGQLGVGSKSPVNEPIEIKLPTEDPDTGIADVSIGPAFSAFVDKVGDLYTAGFNGSTLSGGMGFLGLGDADERLYPTLVESLIEDGCQVKQVAVGEAHMTVLTSEGEVLSCGSGSYGRLGNFDAIDQLYLEPVELLTSGVDAIAGGKSFTLALKEGIVYGWGRNHKVSRGIAFRGYLTARLKGTTRHRFRLSRRYVRNAVGTRTYRYRRIKQSESSQDCGWTFSRRCDHGIRGAIQLGNVC